VALCFIRDFYKLGTRADSKIICNDSSKEITNPSTMTQAFLNYGFFSWFLPKKNAKCS